MNMSVSFQGFVPNDGKSSSYVHSIIQMAIELCSILRIPQLQVLWQKSHERSQIKKATRYVRFMTTAVGMFLSSFLKGNIV